MARQTYSEKLQDPRWQKKRLLILERDNWTCVKCKATTVSLQVHHKKYFPGYNPWEYADSILETLCKVCHAKEHDLIPEVEYERKYQHLLVSQQEPDVITTINGQLGSLQLKLQENIDTDLMEDILKNIMFLTNKKKELLQR